MNMKKRSKLIFVFVHGTSGWGSYDERYRKMPYWGMRSGDLLAYLRGRGYECYAASVSPYGSAWDRACELYAQLYGERVDYGCRHSERYGHERFGRDYSDCPLIRNPKDAMLVLIGHSFGGTTARMFAELMENGDEEERAYTERNDISRLFLGGLGYQVRAVVAVASALNGNAVFEMLADTGYDPGKVRVPWWSRLFGKMMSNQLQEGIDGRDLRDCGDYDMQIDQAFLMNERLGTLPDVFYFSVPCCFTRRKGNSYIPEKGMEPFFVMRSCQMGQYTGVTKGGIKIDQSWKRNDGRVSTISEIAPFNAPRKKLDPDHIRPGIWNVYPVFHGDHMSLQGGLIHKRDIRAFYERMLTMIAGGAE
jgi:triacylglycerol lipase